MNPVAEHLERRRLLAIAHYNIPSVDPTTSQPVTIAHLRHTVVRGEVAVFLNDDTSSVFTFTGASDTDHIDASSATQTCSNEVPAYYMPSGGITYVGWSKNTFVVVADDNDRKIDVGGTNSAITVTVTDTIRGGTGTCTFTVGVANLVIRTNDVVASDVNDGTTVNVSGPNTFTTLTIDTGAGTYDTININRWPNAKIITGAGHDAVNVTRNGPEIDFGAGTGIGDGFGLGNSLTVGPKGWAYLAPLAGPDHVVVVDDVVTLASLFVDHPAAIGNLLVKPLGSINVNAPITVEDCTVDETGVASITMPAKFGSFVVNGQAEFTGTSQPTSIRTLGTSNGVVTFGGVITVAEPSYVADATVFGPYTTVTFETSQTFGSLTMWQGAKAVLQPREAAPVSSGPRSLTVKQLIMNVPGEQFPGVIDLSDNDLIIDYDGFTPLGSWDGTQYTGIAGLLATGRNGGAWTGSGIVTSMSAATGGNTLTTLGVGEASDILGISGAQTALYGGQTVDATTVIVKYTYSGDANLDGVVSGDDYFAIDSAFPQNLHGFANGDFNYDGVIDGDDYFLIDSTFPAQGPPL